MFQTFCFVVLVIQLFHTYIKLISFKFYKLFFNTWSHDAWDFHVLILKQSISWTSNLLDSAYQVQYLFPVPVHLSNYVFECIYNSGYSVMTTLSYLFPNPTFLLVFLTFISFPWYFLLLLPSLFPSFLPSFWPSEYEEGHLSDHRDRNIHWSMVRSLLVT